MMTSKEPLARSTTISRRTLLTAGLGAGVVSVLAACSTPAPPAPTQAPAAATPATAAKPAATTQPAAAPQPTAAAAPKPAAPAAAKPDLGQLVGKLEGATIVTDPAMIPKT